MTRFRQIWTDIWISMVCLIIHLVCSNMFLVCNNIALRIVKKQICNFLPFGDFLTNRTNFLCITLKFLPFHVFRPLSKYYLAIRTALTQGMYFVEFNTFHFSVSEMRVYTRIRVGVDALIMWNVEGLLIKYCYEVLFCEI